MKRREFCAKAVWGAAALAGGRICELGASAAFPQQPQPAPGLTRYVAEFIANTKYEDIPANILALGKKSILDGFGLALAGSVSSIAPLVHKYVDSLGHPDGAASIIGTNMKAAPRFAAFANGVALHSDDFDDTAMIIATLVHATVPVLPPVFALCELDRRTGKDLMLAYHVGVEVGCKIAEAISPRHFDDGYHPTGTIGSFSSAAACAKLRGLSVQQTAYALGIVAAEAAGLRDNFGSMTKPFQAGHAAENGVAAADLAAIGWTAATDILEAPTGFFHAAGGSFDPAAIANRLGKPWAFTTPGVLIKRFPCGTVQQPFMDEMLRLIRENNLTATAVEKVEVSSSRLEVETLLHHRPKTGLQGKFSMEFCMSILLLERRAVGLGHFTDAVVARPDVQQMISRANFSPIPQSSDMAGNKTLNIILKDGRVISGRVGFAKGSPENPMSYEEVAEKFMGNAEFAKWPTEKAAAVVELVKSLENAPDMRALTAALTPA
jgi:2-methylcitrate dehydratase PrpD